MSGLAEPLLSWCAECLAVEVAVEGAVCDDCQEAAEVSVRTCDHCGRITSGPKFCSSYCAAASRSDHA